MAGPAKVLRSCCCCFLIPSNVLTRLSKHPDPRVAEAAGKTVRINESFRAFRSELRTGVPLGAPVRSTLRRQIFDSKATNDLPGDQVRTEGDPDVADSAVNEAYNYCGNTYDFYKQIFGRESVDGHGRALVSTVHYSQNYDNAFWNGQQMVYGDGDGKVFTHFTGAIEVIAHELTHGVTQFTAQLPYAGQSGALNEHFSDVFGDLVKQWIGKQTPDQADWLIGAGIRGPEFQGRALRDMANPGTAYDDPILGKDPQPAHMKDYVETTDDSGGVHINSGIPNKAFVLACKAISGAAWDVPGKVWYKTLTERLDPSADFRKCAAATVSVARDLFPQDQTIAQKIAQAWSDVGVSVAAPTAPAAVAQASVGVKVADAQAPAALAAAPQQAKRKPRRAKQP